MNDQDYIKEGVELADGWHLERKFKPFVSIARGPNHVHGPVICKPILAAIAAQLTDQVDAMGDGGSNDFIDTTRFGATVFLDNDLDDMASVEVEGPDRRMNTIKAIVDSKVLLGS